jgi:hypothetical protein
MQKKPGVASVNRIFKNKSVILVILTCITFIHCPKVTSSDQMCRELFKAKNRVESPGQACMEFFTIATAGSSRDTQGGEIAFNSSLLQCYIFYDKWQSCKDKSPYWLEGALFPLK